MASEQFEPNKASASAARHWITELLVRWELSELADTAALLTTELVANAVRHGSGSPIVVATVADGYLEVGVTDNEPRLPRLAAHRVAEDGKFETELLSETGRGMFIVDAFATEWGTTTLANGKHVWFRLNAAEWAHRALCQCQCQCQCQYSDNDHVRLESGHRVVAIKGSWD